MNIRTLTTVCAGLAIVTATVTANLWRELRIEREHTAALQAQLAESATHAHVVVIPAPGVAASSGVAPVSAPQVKPNATVSTIASIIQRGGIEQQQLLKDPEYRKAQLAMLRQTIARNYPGLVEELGLSSEEADRLFNLLAEKQMAMTEQATPMTDQPDPAALAEAMRNRQALQREQDDAVRSMLGDAKYRQWQDYQPTRSARVQANSFATTLAESGAPLDSTQIKSLVAAVSGEQRTLQQDIAALARGVDRSDPESQRQVVAALTARQAQSNQHILDAAASQLSAQQLGILRAQFEQQDAVNRASARVRERMQAAAQQ